MTRRELILSPRSLSEGELLCHAHKYLIRPNSDASIQPPRMDSSAPVGTHSIDATAQ